jgi:predicted amidohydrolase YtcJ
VKDKRALNIRDLDHVSRDHPVIVRHRSGHTYFYNSKAFEMAGVTKNTPNPMGGTFDKDEQGELNGRVTDLASAAFSTVGSRRTFTPAEREQRARDGIAHISKQFARYGLTSVHHQGGNLQAMQDVRARGELLHRISYESSGPVLDAMMAAGIHSGFGDEWIRFGSTSEHMVDGSFSERTMALSTPYPGVTPPYKGNITETQETLNAWVERVHRAGIQVNCHANGDVAINMYLTAAERALKLVPRANARPKITHCTLVNPDLVRRIKAIGAVPALFTTYAYYNPDKFVYYGQEMMKSCMAFRSLLDAGVYAAAGSDFSPGPFAALMGIQGMVTRTGWDGSVWGANQRLSVSEAIAVNTYNGAWASGEEAIKGSITAGKFADYVVLADDPHTVAAEKIKDIQIVRWWAEGFPTGRGGYVSAPTRDRIRSCLSDASGRQAALAPQASAGGEPEGPRARSEVGNLKGSHRAKSVTERYRSGRNGGASKASCPKGHVGSNPTLSANLSPFEPTAYIDERWHVGASGTHSATK